MINSIQETLLEKAIDQTGVGVVLSNPRLPDNPIIYVNKGFEEITGYAKEEVIGRNCRFLQGAATNQENVKRIRLAIEQAEVCDVEILNFRKNGQPFWNELHLTPLFDEQGELEYFIGIQKDVTARKSAEEARSLYEKVFQNTMQGVVITDADSQIILVNEAFTKITGYTFEEAVGNKPSMLSSGKQSRAFYEALWESVVTCGQWEGELWNKRKNGEIYPEFLNISEVRNSEGVVTNYVAIFTDITESKNREQQLATLSMRDALTGIGNRREFNRYLQEKWNILSEIEEPISMILIDVDYFKPFNDLYGHLEGDRVLVQIAQRIQRCIHGETALAARYGGEEFAVILPQVDELASVKLAERIRASIAEAGIEHAHSPVKNIVSISCGVASMIPHAEMEIEALIARADKALYEAKQSGRDKVVNIGSIDTENVM